MIHPVNCRPEDDRITIRIPLPPPCLHPNARAGWQEKARAKKKYRHEAAEHAAVQVFEQCGERPRLDQALVELAFIFPAAKGGGNKPHDPDNLVGWSKTSIDALTTAGVFADDRDLVFLPPQQHWLDRDPLSGHLTTMQIPELAIRIYTYRADTCPFCNQYVK